MSQRKILVWVENPEEVGDPPNRYISKIDLGPCTSKQAHNLRNDIEKIIKRRKLPAKEIK